MGNATENPIGLLRDLRTKPDEFMDTLSQMAGTLNCSQVVRALKLSGVLADVSKNQSYSRLAGASLQLLEQTYGPDCAELIHLRNDVACLQKILRHMDETYDEIGIRQIPQANRVAAVLVGTEIFLGSLLEVIKGADPLDVRERYPFVAGIEQNGERVSDWSTVWRRRFDALSVTPGTLLLSLWNDLDGADLESTLEIPQVRTAAGYLGLTEVFSHILSLIDFWEGFDSHLEESPDQITFFHDDEETFEKTFIANERLNQWMTTSAHRLSKVKFRIESNPDLLPLQGFMTRDEAIASLVCAHELSKGVFTEVLLGVQMRYWIRAYTAISVICRNFVQARQPLSALLLKEWCVGKSHDEWKQVFMDAGIPEHESVRLIEYLTFHPDARDLFDCPLVPVGNQLVVVPALGESINAAAAIHSNLLSRQASLSFKGAAFEARVNEMMTQAGVPAKPVSRKKQGAQYQCDCMAVIDDDLVVIEAKSMLRPKRSTDHLWFELKIRSAADQCNRIADFYTHKSNLHYVRREFHLDSDWEPANVHRIIVTSAFLGKAIQVNGCHVVDFSTFARFWQRRPPGILVDDVLYAHDDGLYTGKPTVAGFMEVVENPPAIPLARDRFGERALASIQLSTFTLRFSSLPLERADFAILTDEEIRQLEGNLRKIALP